MMTRFLSTFGLMAFLLSNVAVASEPMARTTMWFAIPSQIVEGARLIDSGRVAKGMAVTRKAMKLNLDIISRMTAQTNLCAGYLHLKLYRNAMKECEAVLKVRPSQWQALNNRGGANNGLGNYDAAIADYSKALSIRPNNEFLLTNLSIAQYNKRMNLQPGIIEREG